MDYKLNIKILYVLEISLEAANFKPYKNISRITIELRKLIKI